MRKRLLSSVGKLSLPSKSGVTQQQVRCEVQWIGGQSRTFEKPKSGSYPPPNTYDEDYDWSVNDPSSYWGRQAERLDWHEKWTTVLDHSHPPFVKWFTGGRLNVCYNALDRHVVGGHGNSMALVWDSPVTDQKQKFSYSELLHHVQSFASVLKNMGVEKGDRVLIYMPMIPQAIITMLACARIGAIHIVVFGGFAAKELSVRIDHGSPRVVVTASAGVEPNRIIEYKPIVDEAIGMSTRKPDKVVVFQRKGIADAPMQLGRDFDWDTEMQKSSGSKIEAVAVEANEPLYIIHTSGTTGLPKGVVRPHGGYAVVLPWSMFRIYNMRPGQTWWAASDLGWVVGHSYICYAPLLAGLTSVIYEGKPVGTPDAGQYFRVVAEHRVSSFFTAPTALRAIRQRDPECYEGRKYNISRLETIHSAGEHLDFETRMWAQSDDAFGVPVLDHWWQTESGWPICAPMVGYSGASFHPAKDSSGFPVPGYNVQVLNEHGYPAHRGQLGRIVVKLPLPPGFCSTLWNDDARYEKTYFKEFQGFYDTADAGVMLNDGQVSVMSRVDDVINVAGHRISGGALEEAVLDHAYVVDCAIIGVPDPIKGEVPIALCVLRDDFDGSYDQVSDEIVKKVRVNVGAVAFLKKVLFVARLPKTRSGKIARNTLSAMAANRPFQIPVTIEDPAVYPEILQVMRDNQMAEMCELPAFKVA